MNSNDTIFSSAAYMFSVPEIRHEIFNVCMDQPMNIISDGLWNHNGSSPTHFSFTVLQLQIVTIFVVTQVFHFILKRLGFPYFVSQVMAGFLLGPSISWGSFGVYKKMLFPFGSADILNTVSSLGYSFFLFTTAVQMDLSLITKTGKKAWVIALSSYFTSVIVGFTLMNVGLSWLERFINRDDIFSSLPMVIITQGGVSFAVVSTLLNELGILNSELGRLALSTAFVNDLTGGIAAGFGADYLKTIKLEFSAQIINMVAFFVYLFGIPLVGRPMMMWVVKNTPEGKPVSKIYIYYIIGSFLGLGFFAGHFNQPFLVGAVILGLAVPEGPPLGSELVSHLELFSNWFLSSIFVTCCTMKVDLKECDSFSFFLIISGFIILAQLIKMLLCMGICCYCKMPFSDGFCLALILTSKGVVDICSYVLVFETLAQNKQVISILIISVMFLGTASTLGVKALYDPTRKYAGYQRRNIMSLKHNHELRVVACIHKTHQMMHMKNMLQLFSPCPENTLVADILHLMELVGRSNPIFIAHRLQQRMGSSYNYSGELIVTFDLFERDYSGSATANTYTAISPVSLMHEDACHLALDKNAALIILPFHVKWGGDGSVESEDSKIRAFNARVLERAPCSIGIMVNRGPSAFNSSSHKVAMVFLGGPDDREALCLAKRFTKNFENKLFVYRLVAHDRDITNWEHMIDDEELREVRGAYGRQENVTYEEKTIEDASQTTFFIKDIANKFDFIVVGRRYGMRSSQTFGLENWTEYSELGVIGDLLASPDMHTRASILVVQQQSTSVS